MCKVFYFTHKEGQAVAKNPKNLEITLLLDFYGDMLTEKQRSMVEYYYDDDCPAEIAENEGISRQGVRDSIKRAEAQMLEMEDRLGLSRRFRRICADAQEIARLAQEICRYGEYPGAPHELSEYAGRIAALADTLQKEQ